MVINPPAEATIKAMKKRSLRSLPVSDSFFPTAACSRFCRCRDSDVAWSACAQIWNVWNHQLSLMPRYLSTEVDPARLGIPSSAYRLSYGKVDVAEKTLVSEQRCAITRFFGIDVQEGVPLEWHVSS